MNKKLLKSYTTKEVEEALLQMNGLSSLGPNGFLAAFYQQHWNIVGGQISESVLFVLNPNEV